MADFVITIPGNNVGAREVARKAADVWNSVTIEGDTPDYPQLMLNGSGEALVRPSSADGGNLVQNPGFELNTGSGSHSSNADDWSRGADANFIQGGQGGKPNARTGSWFAELDSIGESVSQTVDTPIIAPVPGHSYEFGLWGLPEFGYIFSTPPTVTITFQWRGSGADIAGASTTWTQAFTEGAWQQFYRTIPCPAGATGFRLSVTLIGGVFGTDTGKGAVIDDVYLVDVSSLKWSGWDFRQYGAAQVISANWAARGAFDGRNCLYFNVTAEDIDEHDIQVRTTPSYLFKVTGGEYYRFSIRLKSNNGNAVPKILGQVKFRTASNTQSGTEFVFSAVFASAVNADWTEYHYDFFASGDAATCEAWLAIRGNGEGFIDAISFRCITTDPAFSDEDPTTTTYLPAGNLLVTFRADIEFSAEENAAVNGSISRYGLCETVLSAPGVTTITDARVVARGYLLANAVADNSVVIDLYDDPRPFFIGADIAFNGPGSSLYSEIDLPLQRLNGGIDGQGMQTAKLEIGTTKQTTEELIAAITKTTTETMISSSTGAASSNISSNTGFSQPFGTGSGSFQGAWAIGATYGMNDVVGRPTGVYVSLVDDNVGNDPLTDAVNWYCYVPATKGMDDGAFT